MGEGDPNPKSLPRTTYQMARNIEEYVLSQIGITTGQQGFNNNILMMESFMKILPQAIYAQKIGLFSNPLTHKPSSVVIDPLAVDRLDQLWRKGLHVLVYRNPYQTNIIDSRIVAYRHPLSDILYKGKTYLKPWEIMSPCPNCESINKDGKKVKSLIGFMADQNFNVDETTCEMVCKNGDCDFRDFVEVEVKPPLKTMIPLGPRSTNPIWVHVSANILIKYALENTDLMALSSNEGGFYYDLGSYTQPMFTSFEQILTSINFTNFPTHKYYDDTTDLLYDEWLYYYHPTLIQMHEMVTERWKSPQTQTEKPKTQRIKT